jgi:hypothetical protein
MFIVTRPPAPDSSSVGAAWGAAAIAMIYRLPTEVLSIGDGIASTSRNMTLLPELHCTRRPAPINMALLTELNSHSPAGQNRRQELSSYRQEDGDQPIHLRVPFLREKGSESGISQGSSRLAGPDAGAPENRSHWSLAFAVWSFAAGKPSLAGTIPAWTILHRFNTLPCPYGGAAKLCVHFS